MTFGGKKATALLLAGDFLVFYLSLGLMLAVRYGGSLSEMIIRLHLWPFTLLFLVWSFIFYISGLYSKHSILFKNELPGVIVRTQVFNIVLAALLFFFVPAMIIAPKTNLAVYLGISLFLILLWRLSIFPRITKPTHREGAAVVGDGPEVEELVREVNAHPRYQLEFRVIANPAEVAADPAAFAQQLSRNHVSLLVLEKESAGIQKALPELYTLSAGRPWQVVDFDRLYEEVFDRVPLSTIRQEWFMEHTSSPASTIAAVCRRLLDIAGGLIMGVITALLAPFIALAMRIEGPGPIFIAQDRVGQGGTRMRSYKFRSMKLNKSASNQWAIEEKKENPITAVGSVLRRTSIDEFPQFVNILRGELSLIGPRNDIAGIADRMVQEIPYYAMRYSVKPGLTGWAQINQKYEPGNISPQSLQETKVRLAYDFYYIKNRSLTLDIAIALKTIKRMFFRLSSW